MQGNTIKKKDWTVFRPEMVSLLNAEKKNPAQCWFKLVFYLTCTTMHGNTNVTFSDAKQARDIYNYKNIKRKLYRTNAAIWYNKICRHLCQGPPCQFFNTPDDGRLTLETCSDSAEIKPAQCFIKLVFYLTCTTMHGNTKVKRYTNLQANPHRSGRFRSLYLRVYLSIAVIW